MGRRREEVRVQSSGFRKTGTAGTVSALGERSYRVAQQPRPNDKRNPLHHVLRTAGTGRAFEGGALRGGGSGARSCGRGREGSGFGVQEKRSEVRIQRSGKAPKGWHGGRGRGDGAGKGQRWCREQPHGRTRTNTDRHGPQAWAMVFPGTWNLKPRWTATRTNTDGHGRTRTVGKRAEVRGNRRGGRGARRGRWGEAQP